MFGIGGADDRQRHKEGFDDMIITLSSKEPNGVPFRRWERKVTSIVLLISSSVVLGSIGPGMGCCWGECLFV